MPDLSDDVCARLREAFRRTSYDADGVVAALGDALQKLTSDPAKAVEVLGAIQNDGVAQRIDASRQLGKVVVDSRTISHPQFPEARVRSPLLLKVDVRDEDKFTQELFGPIAFVIATDGA